MSDKFEWTLFCACLTHFNLSLLSKIKIFWLCSVKIDKNHTMESVIQHVLRNTCAKQLPFDTISLPTGEMWSHLLRHQFLRLFSEKPRLSWEFNILHFSDQCSVTSYSQAENWPVQFSLNRAPYLCTPEVCLCNFWSCSHTGLVIFRHG